MISATFTNKEYGWYAYVENDSLVIGDNYPREGGELYRGKYIGENTPYLSTIKKEDRKLYNRIIKYFETNKSNIYNLYKVICYVDNGCSGNNYENYVCTSSDTKAAEIVKNYWDSQYDTISQINEVKKIGCTSEGLICVKKINNYKKG